MSCLGNIKNKSTCMHLSFRFQSISVGGEEHALLLGAGGGGEKEVYSGFAQDSCLSPSLSLSSADLLKVTRTPTVPWALASLLIPREKLSPELCID